MGSVGEEDGLSMRLVLAGAAAGSVVVSKGWASSVSALEDTGSTGSGGGRPSFPS